MQPSIRFGEDFELDPRAYQLRRAGRSLKLERIPMEILLLLTEQRGQLVSREQIAERIWGKGHFLDTDNSINGAIRKIRQILRDHPEQPRFIQTVTGRGYRFIAPVLESGEPKGELSPPGPEPRPRARLALGVTLSVLVVAVAAWVVWSRSQTPRPVAGRVMLAVLPFENLTGDAAQEYFSDGLTEEMITQLGNVDPQHLQVIARTSVMRYKNGRTPLDQVGRELGVQYIIEGSVRRDANDVRVTAQLIEAKDQRQIWAQQYDRELKDLLALQGEIAQRIAVEILSTLGRGTSRALPPPARTAREYEAYDLYLKGLYFWNKRTVPAFETAIRYFTQATIKDSTYARAYAGLASSYELLMSYSGRPPQELLSKARASALKALELDPGLAEAHTAYALLVQNHDWDWQTAERGFRRAIELNPNYATAHHWYAEHLMWRGRFDEALRESDRALQLDPLSLIIATDRGEILYLARQYDRAIETWRSVLELDPEFPRAHLIQWAYVEKGMLAEARADFERHGPGPMNVGYWSWLAAFYGRSGQPEQARHAIRKMRELSARQQLPPGSVARTYAAVGERDSALAYLERAYAEHSGELTTLKVNPVYDSLRSDPRFQSLLRRVGLAP
ncbi:MAG TPA: winged helix-turn-helix domain-containing protein [Gemmatimonadales bacterium]|nr:winged helix-turn-helix domain-containing protein [Gemmatimonadales bacterium]